MIKSNTYSSIPRQAPNERAILKQVNTLAWLLDNSIKLPLINYRIGFDPLIGLIPGFGDIAGLIVSAYIVLQGMRLGAPQSVLFQMMGNILIEALVGIVPGIGDLFDATYKSNALNVQLLNEATGNPHIGPVNNNFVDKRLLWVIVIAFFALVALIGLAGIAFFWWLVQLIRPY